MLKLKHNSSIVFDDEQPFRPGDVVKGTASWSLQQPSKVQFIKLVFNGQCKVKWEVDDEKTYKSCENYFEHDITLRGDENGQSISIAPGQYRSPFHYRLPQNLPSSFCGSKGSVTYTITLCSDSDSGRAVEFKVVNPVSGPANPSPIRMMGEGKDSSCFFGTTASLTFDVTTNKSSYIPGERILINGYVTNGSSSSPKAKLQLVQLQTFFGKRSDFSLTSSGNLKSKKKKYLVEEWRGEGLRAWDTHNFVDRPTFTIPEIPESELKNCQSIDVKYFLNFTVALPGLCSLMLKSYPVEVFIGNVSADGSVPRVLPSAPQDTEIAGSNYLAPADVQLSNLPEPAPPYKDVTSKGKKEPKPPAYSEVVGFGSTFSSNVAAPSDSQNAQSGAGNTFGNYYDWNQSAFTYS